MLGKAIITAATVVAATVGIAGVAYAGDYDSDGAHSGHGSDHSSHHDGDHHGHGHRGGGKNVNSPDCSSHEKTKQINKGTQVLGNVVAKHIDGGVAGSIEKPGLCPSIGNNNKVFGR